MIEATKILGYMRTAATEILQRGWVGPGKPLRPSQHDGLEAYVTFLDRDDLMPEEKLSGFWEIPTGVGKSALFSGLAAKAIEAAARDDAQLRVGIIVPTITLTTQNRDEALAVAVALERKIGIYGGKHRQLDQPVTIITYDSWASLTDAGTLNAESFDLLISDEGHRGTSVAREQRLIDHYNGIAKLAFTATAHFDPDKTVYNTHRHKIYEKYIATAVKDGELAAYVHAQFYGLRVEPDETADAEDRKRARQLAFNQFTERLLVTGRDERTGDLLTDNQGAVFVQDTAQANHLEALLNSNPVLQERAQLTGYEAFAVAIHTIGIPDKEQERREQAYKKGRYLFVIGDEKFKEGFDHPPMKTVIDMPHGSLVDKAQILGRGARQYYNQAKQRHEGLTFVDTVIYHGRKDTESDKQAWETALANAVTAIEVLDGDILVLGPSAPPPVTPQPPAQPPPVTFPTTPPGPDTAPVEPPVGTNVVIVSPPVEPSPAPQPPTLPPSDPFAGLQVRAYATLEDMRLLLTERQQAQAETQQQEEMIDWSNPENRKEFEALRYRKGMPGGVILFNLLPEETKQQDANGKTLFGISHRTIADILSGELSLVSLHQLQILTQLLENMEDMIEWRGNPKNHRKFKALLKKKGSLGYKILSRVLSEYAKQPDANGKFLFGIGNCALAGIIRGEVHWISSCQLQVLMQTLENMEDLIEWQDNPKNRKQFEALRKRKGNPGHLVISNAVPESAKQPDANGELLFGVNNCNIQGILDGTPESVSPRQLRVLTQILENMEDMIEWRDSPENRREFELLLKRKGNPGYRVLFNILPEDTKQLDANGNILFGSKTVIQRIMAVHLYPEWISVCRLQVLTRTLIEQFPDADIRAQAEALGTELAQPAPRWRKGKLAKTPSVPHAAASRPRTGTARQGWHPAAGT